MNQTGKPTRVLDEHNRTQS